VSALFLAKKAEMPQKSPASAEQDKTILAALLSDEYRFYPEEAVMFGFPWGKKGSPLEKVKGPRKWQLKELAQYGEHLRRNQEKLDKGEDTSTYQFACCSGRGPGKSALYGMISWFHMSCWLGSTTIVAANGEPQLDTKTFPEIKKWFTLSINSHWFDLAARSVKPAQWFKESIEKQLKVDCGYYYVQGQLWTEDKPDSFAGAHNPLGLIVLFDEASGIPAPIWVVAKGFFTEHCATRAHFAFSNGRKNTGAFFECFNKMRNFWHTLSIDSRTVEGVDCTDLNQIVTQYGEDSDEARIEVRGLFPKFGNKQLISHETIEAACTRQVVFDPGASLTMAVDVARFGHNKSVISFKQGRDARSIPWQRYQGIRVTELYRHCVDAIEEYKPDAIFVDSNGVGGPLADMLIEDGYNVIEVENGNNRDPMKYFDGRTQRWCEMAEWLEVAAIPDEDTIKDDLGNPEFDYSGKDSKKKLESKDQMENRGIASPDDGDSLSLHFAKHVARRDYNTRSRRPKGRVAKDVDYDVLSQ
jgi:hypothetical protein